MEKQYDLVVFGASGFTGQLICEYLSEHNDIKNINWAIAGRNKSKLEKIKLNNTLLKDIDILFVDSFKHDTIDQMCQSASLVLSTVGPYSLYGEYLIQSLDEGGYLWTRSIEFVEKECKDLINSQKPEDIMELMCSSKNS